MALFKRKNKNQGQRENGETSLTSKNGARIAELKEKKSTGIFSKLMVLYCLAVVSAASFYTFWLIGTRGIDANGTLTVVCGLFGAELMLLCMKRIFAKSDEKDAKIDLIIEKLVKQEQVEQAKANGTYTVDMEKVDQEVSISEQARKKVANTDYNYSAQAYGTDGGFESFTNRYKYVSNNVPTSFLESLKTQASSGVSVVDTDGKDNDNNETSIVTAPVASTTTTTTVTTISSDPVLSSAGIPDVFGAI